MKIYGTLLALSALHPSTAFVAQGPGRKSLSTKGWKSAHAVSPSLSYLGNLRSSDLASSYYTDVDVKSTVNGDANDIAPKSEAFDLSYTVRRL